MPEEVKEVLQAVAIDYRRPPRGYRNWSWLRLPKRLTSPQVGTRIADVSAEDRAAWAAAMPNIAQELRHNEMKTGANRLSKTPAPYLEKSKAQVLKGVVIVRIVVGQLNSFKSEKGLILC